MGTGTGPIICGQRSPTSSNGMLRRLVTYITKTFWEGKKEMFYFMMHSTHMVKNHSDSERGNSLPLHGLFFQIAARVLLHVSTLTQDNTHHNLCYTSSMSPP